MITNPINISKVETSVWYIRRFERIILWLDDAGIKIFHLTYGVISNGFNTRLGCLAGGSVKLSF